MSKFENYLKRFDIAANVTDEELEKTQALLQLYGPTLRRSSRRLEEFEEECYQCSGHPPGSIHGNESRSDNRREAAILRQIHPSHEDCHRSRW